LHDQIVDAHRDEILADRIVRARLDRDLELGANAVRRGDEERILIAAGFEIEEGAEAAQARGGAEPRRRFRGRLDRLDQRIAGIDVDPGFLVSFRGYGPISPLRRAGFGALIAVSSVE
jgi:hypothetical protein